MTFEELNLNRALLQSLQNLGYTVPTTIQHRAFPVIMSGRDVIGIAQTGTGKTVSYLLPILRQWEYTTNLSPRVLILVPTSEMVTQVVDVATELSQGITVTIKGVYGGTNLKSHIALVQEGVNILVATPGRLLDLILSGTLNIKGIKKLVIDEVDEMLDLGFRHQVTTVLNLLPIKRQTLMFSATLSSDVELIINEYFKEPIKIEAAPTGTPLDNIEQVAYLLPNFYTKVNMLRLLLSNQEEFKKVLVFAETKKLADQLHENIAEKFTEQIGIIHSNKSQNHRFDTVAKFKDGTYRILIATDIIARGIDISEVSHVINFDTPDTPENYIHRIGRTGRADKKGISITFITPSEQPYQEAIEQLMNRPIPMADLPETLVLSTELTEDEMPKQTITRNIFERLPIKQISQGAFQEKKEKNKKTNFHLTRGMKQKLKYGKPKTKGTKQKK